MRQIGPTRQADARRWKVNRFESIIESDLIDLRDVLPDVGIEELLSDRISGVAPGRRMNFEERFEHLRLNAFIRSTFGREFVDTF